MYVSQRPQATPLHQRAVQPPLAREYLCQWRNTLGQVCKEALPWTEGCFCGHKRSSHKSDTGNYSCRLYNCQCARYRYIPRLKSDVVSPTVPVQKAALLKASRRPVHSGVNGQWLPICSCGHNNLQHHSNLRRNAACSQCKRCTGFEGAFSCAVCHKSFQDHVTVWIDDTPSSHHNHSRSNSSSSSSSGSSSSNGSNGSGSRDIQLDLHAQRLKRRPTGGLEQKRKPTPRHTLPQQQPLSQQQQQQKQQQQQQQAKARQLSLSEGDFEQSEEGDFDQPRTAQRRRGARRPRQKRVKERKSQTDVSPRDSSARGGGETTSDKNTDPLAGQVASYRTNGSFRQNLTSTVSSWSDMSEDDGELFDFMTA